MLLFMDSREQYEKRFCLRHSDGGFIVTGPRRNGKSISEVSTFSAYSSMFPPSLSMLLNIYLACHFTFANIRRLFQRTKNTSKLIKMTSAGLSRMFAMIILFIFQFQIATNLIKYAVRFFAAREGRGKKAMQTR